MNADTSTPKRPFIDCEAIYAKLMLFGTVVGLMDANPENFGEQEYFALQALLYQTAKEVWPEWKQDKQ